MIFLIKFKIYFMQEITQKQFTLSSTQTQNYLLITVLAGLAINIVLMMKKPKIIIEDHYIEKDIGLISCMTCTDMEKNGTGPTEIIIQNLILKHHRNAMQFPPDRLPYIETLKDYVAKKRIPQSFFDEIVKCKSDEDFKALQDKISSHYFTHTIPQS